MRKLYVLAVGLMMLAACSTTLNFQTLRMDADQLYQSGDYSGALVAYENIIGQFGEMHEDFSPELYLKAALSALNSGNKEVAVRYFEKCRDNDISDAEMWWTLAGHYQAQNNLPMEMTALNRFLSDFPEDSRAVKASDRYFETLVKSGKYEEAFEFWANIKEHASTDVNLMEQYFTTCQKLEKEKEVKEICDAVIALSPDFKPALFHKAQTLYNRAEDRYKKEMAAYAKTKTHVQYTKLKRALRKSSAEFRESRDLFEHLYDLDANAAYARYLTNIYLRLDNKSESDRWRKLIK